MFADSHPNMCSVMLFYNPPPPLAATPILYVFFTVITTYVSLLGRFAYY